MTEKIKILAFAGSTRRDSYNKKILNIAVNVLNNNSVDVTIIDFKNYNIPFYDGDLENEKGIPEDVKKIKRLMIENDGFLIASPEYNSSISGVLKNAIDWASRPQDGEPPLACFKNKTAALISASEGKLGGLRGLSAVRSILSSIMVIVIPDQYAVPFADKAFDDNNELIKPVHKKSIENVALKLLEITIKLK